MKRVLLYMIALLFIWHNGAMSEKNNVGPALLEEIDSQTFRPFLNALKSGNIEAIKRYLTEKKSEETGLLDLEGDEYREYSDMLKNYYKGVVFSIEQGVVSEGQIIVDVAIEFPGGGQSITQYYLQEQSGNASQSSEGRRWRINAERKKREGEVSAE